MRASLHARERERERECKIVSMYLPYVREISYCDGNIVEVHGAESVFSHSPVVDSREWHTMIESPW